MGKRLIKNGYFLTLNQQSPITKGSMVINDSVIEGIYKDELDLTFDDVIDAKGKLVIPGLINTHGHTGSSLLRGAGDDLPLYTWLSEVMWPAEQTFTKDTIQAATSLAMSEMLKSGTTTFLDMYHLHMDQTAELILNCGMNGVLCRGMIGLCSSEEQKEKLDESVNLFKRWHGIGDGRLNVMLSPHAPYTCPPLFLEQIIDKSRQFGIGLHTHLAETRKEVQEHIKNYGKSPGEHLDELGFFDGHALIAHGVHLSRKEIEVLGKKGVYISHNPKSNLKLGSGIMNIKEMLAQKVNVTIGTDSTASNNTLDLFEEMRFSSLIHKGVNEDPTVTTARDVLLMGTRNGAKALGFENKGVLESGFDADLTFVDITQSHVLPNDQERLVSHLIYAIKGSDVTDVFVKGKQLVKNRELLTLDEEKIHFEANEVLKAL
ncbi:amidohydrolase [Alteribacter aurantiacus]|uniref:amidohydrolase n=1 Tax=Alteribacter aurantiacus TaxID=254410 RepID=UPI0004113675|nr:amidohydrolase [Alteribacter aurantiacus]